MTTFLMIGGWLIAAVVFAVNLWLIRKAFRQWLKFKRLEHLLKAEGIESNHMFDRDGGLNRSANEWPEVIENRKDRISDNQ